MKAIHNAVAYCVAIFVVVINHKTTKFESNSQPATRASDSNQCCYQSQNYKIWKQSTTTSLVKNSITSLLSITKLQNLKGIHNCSLEPLVSLSVVINRKTTKFESNSQLPLIITFTMFRRYQSQNYKIWKQFTTHFLSKLIRVWLLSIIKLQNLKAIHNNIHMNSSGSCVVINHKTTKFESNSQPCSGVMLRLFCCYQS